MRMLKIDINNKRNYTDLNARHYVLLDEIKHITIIYGETDIKDDYLLIDIKAGDDSIVFYINKDYMWKINSLIKAIRSPEKCKQDREIFGLTVECVKKVREARDR